MQSTSASTSRSRNFGTKLTYVGLIAWKIKNSGVNFINGLSKGMDYFFLTSSNEDITSNNTV